MTGRDERELAAGWLENQRAAGASFKRWVRVRPVNAPQWREDVAAVMSAEPDGVIMTGVENPDDVRRLGSELYELEQRHGMALNSVPLVLELGATARGSLATERLALDPHPRVAGVTWDPAMLARDIGSAAAPGKIGWPAARACRGAGGAGGQGAGRLRPGGAVPGVARSGGVRTRLRARPARRVRRHGRDPPAQLAEINHRFTPTEAERELAAGVVALFDAAPSANMLSLEGRIIDRATGAGAAAAGTGLTGSGRCRSGAEC